MPQVMIGLSGKDYKTTTDVWRLAKRSLNPMVRRRIGWRGRSSLLREFMLYGFELASQNPENFLRAVRDNHDPLFGRKGRKDAGAERRETLVASWESFFPSQERGSKGRKGSSQ
jgi:hypothetical protein